MEENVPMATIKAQLCKEDEVETREVWLWVAQVEMSFPLFLSVFSPRPPRKIEAGILDNGAMGTCSSWIQVNKLEAS